MEKLFKTLGDENRLRILNLLTIEELCVCEIEVVLDLTQSNVSRHLAKLRSAGLIIGDKDKQWIHYKVSDGVRLDNRHLFDYLLDKFQGTTVYQQDKNRLKSYKESSYTCQTIRADRAFVMNYLEAENSF